MISTKETGSKIKCKDKELINLRVVQFTRESFSTIYVKAKENTNCNFLNNYSAPMEKFTKELGGKEKEAEEES